MKPHLLLLRALIKLRAHSMHMFKEREGFMSRDKSITNQLNGYTAQDVKDKTKDLAQTTISSVQDIGSKAKDVAQTTAASVQENVQSGLGKTQDALLVGLDMAQGLLKRNQKMSARDIKKAKKNMRKTQKAVQESVQSGWSNTQDVLQIALGVAQVLLEANKQLASKNIKQAKKNFGQLTDVVQGNVQSGMGIAQDVLGKGTKRATKNLQKVTSNVQSELDKSTKRATKNLQKVTSNVKDVQSSVQDRIESYQRKRARKKFMFRLGLIAGVVGALLFAPWPGSETRRQLGEYWQLLSQRTQQLLNRLVG